MLDALRIHDEILKNCPKFFGRRLSAENLPDEFFVANVFGDWFLQLQ